MIVCVCVCLLHVEPKDMLNPIFEMYVHRVFTLCVFVCANIVHKPHPMTHVLGVVATNETESAMSVPPLRRPMGFLSLYRQPSLVSPPVHLNASCGVQCLCRPRVGDCLWVRCVYVCACIQYVVEYEQCHHQHVIMPTSFCLTKCASPW